MNKRPAEIAPVDPVWEDLRALVPHLPEKLRRAFRHHPQLLGLKAGTVSWVDIAQPGGLLEELRGFAEDLTAPVSRDEPAEPAPRFHMARLDDGTPHIGYIGAVSFAVVRLAEEENRQLLNAFRRPLQQVFARQMLERLKELHADAAAPVQEYAEQSEPELSAPRLAPVDSGLSLDFLQGLSKGNDFDRPDAIAQASGTAYVLLLEYLDSPNAPAAVVEVARQAMAGEGASAGRVRVLLFESETEVARIPFEPETKFLAMLHVWARLIAARYRWDEGAAAAFVLCGARPTKKVARVTYDVRPALPCTTTVTLELDPALTVDEVARIYRSALSELGAEKRKGLSPKHLALAWVATLVPDIHTWSSALFGWNRHNASRFDGKPYSKLPIFRRDCETARQRLLHPKWKTPPRGSRYPPIA